MSVSELIKHFDNRLEIKHGFIDKNRDPMNNLDFKGEFKKRV